MDTFADSHEMTNLFEAILDAQRLLLISHLSQNELTLAELASQSDMGLKETHRHLDVLISANLVSAHNQEGKPRYRFNPQHLEQIKRQQFAKPKEETRIDALGFPEEQQKILADYTHQDGRLKMIPTKSKKIIAILDYISLTFEKEIHYSERQVNEILEQYYADTTTLRRYLIDYRYLSRSRNGADYWYIGSQDSEAGKS